MQPCAVVSRYAALYVVPVVLLLLIAHYLVTVQFNISPLYLRLASFAIPLPFGMATYAVNKIGWRGAFGIGALIAFLSVSGMLTVIGFIDNVPIIPPTFLEWRELFEYGFEHCARLSHRQHPRTAGVCCAAVDHRRRAASRALRRSGLRACWVSTWARRGCAAAPAASRT